MTIGEKYCEDVISGKEITGKLMRLTVERHLNDLDKARRNDIEFRYSPERAAHCVDFMERMKHTKGILANQNFLLSPIQNFMTSMMFGWQTRHEDTGLWVRRYTKSYTEVARKWGKTAWMGAGGNYLLYGDGEEGAEVYSFATKLDQARIVHKVSRSMTNKYLKEHLRLQPHLTVMKDNISYLLSESSYEPLPATSDKLDGLNPHGGLGDEVHEFEDPDLINVIETGMGSRLQPMLWLITTAGFNIFGPGYAIRTDQIKALKGITVDDRSVSFINTLDDGDDWNDQSVWAKSNPHIGITPYWDYMRRQYKKAKNEGGRTEIEFKTKNMNIWTTSGDTWIQDDEWCSSSDGPFDLEILRDRACYLGLDLSTNRDLTSLQAFFPPTAADPKARTLSKFFCPEDTIPERSKSDRVNYQLWADEKHITPTPGKTVKYEYIIQTLKEWKAKYNIVRLDYDKAFAYQMIAKVEELGIKVFVYGQNTNDMNAPIQDIERRITDGELDHGMHPILRWNVSNVMLFTDSNGKQKFHKGKVVDRIDGIVALAMAVGGYLSVAPRGRSRYNNEGMFPGMTG